MRPTSELLRLAIGHPGFTIVESLKDRWSCFDAFHVQLPLPDFRGIPPEWVFAVLRRSEPIGDRPSTAPILEEARRMLDTLPRHKPVVLVSDDQSLHLSDEFNLTDRNVFCLDAVDLPKQEARNLPPRLSPFVLALQRKIKWNQPAALLFSPYERARPVSGWRFFGRKRELKELVHSHANVVLVGPRRVGKTSLMQEAKRSIEMLGEQAYYVNVQDCKNSPEVVGLIARSLDPREAEAALRRKKALDEPLFSVILRRLSLGRQKTTLFLDELGNVLANMPKEDWKFWGILRKFTQEGQLRCIISCFQEMFLKQQTEFEGPLVNFGHTMRLEIFSEAEVDEFMFAPLEFWKPLDAGQKRELLQAITSVVGSHPYLLQYYGFALFQRLTEEENANIRTVAKTLLRRDLVDCFSAPVEELFYRIPSATLKYLFLRGCKEADDSNRELWRSQLDDDWLESTLTSMGYRSTVAARRNLLEGLEIHGLCKAVDKGRSRQMIAAPVVYLYVKQTEAPLERFIAKLQADIAHEFQAWDLVPV